MSQNSTFATQFLKSFEDRDIPMIKLTLKKIKLLRKVANEIIKKEKEYIVLDEKEIKDLKELEEDGCIIIDKKECCCKAYLTDKGLSLVKEIEEFHLNNLETTYQKILYPVISIIIYNISY